MYPPPDFATFDPSRGYAPAESSFDASPDTQAPPIMDLAHEYKAPFDYHITELPHAPSKRANAHNYLPPHNYLPLPPVCHANGYRRMDYRRASVPKLWELLGLRQLPREHLRCRPGQPAYLYNFYEELERDDKRRGFDPRQ
jgi:hypothetical protein